MHGEIISQNMAAYTPANMSQEKQTRYMNHLADLKETCRKAEMRFKQEEKELAKV